MATSPRPATFDELDAVKKQLVDLERRVDGVVNGVNGGLRHAQQADQRIEAAMRSADAAMRRTERLDSAKIAALQALDVALLVTVVRGWAQMNRSVEKLEQSVAKLERQAGHH